MSSKPRRSAQSSSQLPTKWAVAIVFALIGYTLAQPLLNRRFGWNLPSLAGEQLTQPLDPAPGKTTHRTADAKSPASDGVDAREADPTTTDQPRAKSNTHTDQTTESSKASTETASLRYGFLRETAPDDYLSPAGLHYTRGGAEGHRLNHIERHLQDDPNRPGSHGVFDGDMAQVVRWIDEAYVLAKRGARGTSHSDEGEGRTKIEASFSKPIGYVGGRDGKRAHHPDARRIRIIVEGNKVITAFPIK